MTAQERITEWAALADKATEGPWLIQDEGGDLFPMSGHAKPYGDSDRYVTYRTGFFDADDLEDLEFIAASRTAVPAMAAALTAVLERHRPQERCHDGDGSWSVARDEWDADYDGDPETFVVCAHCGAIEMHESTRAGDYHTYVDSLWPCPTVAAIETALGVTS